MKPKNLSEKYGCLKNVPFILLSERDLDVLPCEDEPFFKGNYYDLYKKGDQFFLVSKVNKSDFWRDVFWKQRNELVGWFRRLGYGGSSNDLVGIVRDSCLIVMNEDFSIQDYYNEVTGLSNSRFVAFMNDFLNGEEYDPERNALGSAEYSHTKHFAWIYLNELKAIQKICGQRPTSVLELGSSFGNSIFSKISVMDMPTVTYFGIDIDLDLVESSLRYAQNNQIRNASFYQEDVRNLNSVRTCLGRPNFDIVTASHLLEHIEGQKEKIIEDWLSLANYALLLAVPFDRGLSSLITDHKDQFTQDSLRQISYHFQRTQKNLIVDESYINSGILIFYMPGGEKN